ncbi:hypothetical protein R1flu_003743 [Riccia fluitans]|uniref:Uncharacterized protein n=1 Tax=Riccia fluitans TaxID=41844 RepID=A0ABD1YA16_9MARC
MEDLGGNERIEIEGIQEAIQSILDILLNPIKLDQEEDHVGLRPTHLLDKIQFGVESSGKIELKRDCKKRQGDKLDIMIVKMTKRGQVGKTRVAKKGKENGKKKQRVKLITEDYDVVVTYIENPDHYRDITGAGKKMRIGVSMISKVRAFDIMASALSGVNGFPQVTDEEMKKHFVQYENMYKDTRRWKDSTSAGLTDVEILKGLTMEEKLNKLCPHFRRMVALYGKRPNIVP